MEYFMLAIALAGGITNLIATFQGSEEEKKQLEHLKDIYEKKYVSGSELSNTQFDLQSAEAIWQANQNMEKTDVHYNDSIYNLLSRDNLADASKADADFRLDSKETSTQLQKEDSSYQLDSRERSANENIKQFTNDYNTSLLMQAFGEQDSRIQNESAIGASLASEGMSGTRGNTSNDLMRSYASQGLERQIDVQNQQNRNTLYGTTQEADRLRDDINYERNSLNSHFNIAMAEIANARNFSNQQYNIAKADISNERNTLNANYDITRRGIQHEIDSWAPGDLSLWESNYKDLNKKEGNTINVPGGKTDSVKTDDIIISMPDGIPDIVIPGINIPSIDFQIPISIPEINLPENSDTTVPGAGNTGGWRWQMQQAQNKYNAEMKDIGLYDFSWQKDHTQPTGWDFVNAFLGGANSGLNTGINAYNFFENVDWKW